MVERMVHMQLFYHKIEGMSIEIANWPSVSFYVTIVFSSRRISRALPHSTILYQIKWQIEAFH